MRVREIKFLECRKKGQQSILRIHDWLAPGILSQQTKRAIERAWQMAGHSEVVRNKKNIDCDVVAV